MAAQGGDEGADVYKGGQKIELAHLLECLQRINAWGLKPCHSLVVCDNSLPENIMVYWGVSICASCPQGSQLSFFPGVLRGEIMLTKA